jgi:hypothetical protein
MAESTVIAIGKAPPDAKITFEVLKFSIITMPLNLNPLNWNCDNARQSGSRRQKICFCRAVAWYSDCGDSGVSGGFL